MSTTTCDVCLEELEAGAAHACAKEAAAELEAAGEGAMTDLEALGFVEDLLANALEQGTLPALEAAAKDEASTELERANAGKCVAAARSLLKGMRADVARLTQPQSIIRPGKADRDLILRTALRSVR